MYITSTFWYDKDEGLQGWLLIFVTHKKFFEFTVGLFWGEFYGSADYVAYFLTKYVKFRAACRYRLCLWNESRNSFRFSARKNGHFCLIFSDFSEKDKVLSRDHFFLRLFWVVFRGSSSWYRIQIWGYHLGGWIHLFQEHLFGKNQTI